MRKTNDIAEYQDWLLELCLFETERIMIGPIHLARNGVTLATNVIELLDAIELK